MIENFITMLTIVFPFALFIGGIAFFCYIENEQEHRHKLELEKAKQGIFDQPTDKEPFYKKILQTYYSNFNNHNYSNFNLLFF